MINRIISFVRSVFGRPAAPVPPVAASAPLPPATRSQSIAGLDDLVSELGLHAEVKEAEQDRRSKPVPVHAVGDPSPAVPTPVPTVPAGLIPPAAVEIVAMSEGYREHAYLCPAKVWTVGYGSTRWADGRPVVKGDVVDHATARTMLMADLRGAAHAVDALVTVPLTEHQRAADQPRLQYRARRVRPVHPARLSQRRQTRQRRERIWALEPRRRFRAAGAGQAPGGRGGAVPIRAAGDGVIDRVRQ